jgi:Na+/H+-dicarboxylate symporter
MQFAGMPDDPIPRPLPRTGLGLVAALVAGLALGLALHALVIDPVRRGTIADIFTVLSDVFLRLIGMIIAPLVFSTLVLGIARLRGTASLARIGLKTLAWFVVASPISLVLGWAVARLIAPGVAMPAGAAPAAASLAAPPFDGHAFVLAVFPRSIVESMADNNILQIVVFSIFFGSALAAAGARGRAVVSLIEDLAAIMMTVTGYVMRLAPVAVVAALAATIATRGPEILAGYVSYIAGFYLALALLAAILALAMIPAAGARALPILAALRQPMLIAFATASSQAAYPALLDGLERAGVPNRVASFVLPLGYSFNMDGAMMFCPFAVLFVAQAYGISLTFAQQAVMLTLLMVSTKGLAGVPRASLVIIAGTLKYLGLPAEGMLLIIAVDQLLDMGRTAINVLGNGVAAAIVARWEGLLQHGPDEVI